MALCKGAPQCIALGLLSGAFCLYSRYFSDLADSLK